MHVAIVCADESVRMEVAKAFDDAPPHWRITLHHARPPSADVIVTADDCEGDVRFDPTRPQAVLAEVVQAITHPPAVVPVVAASGGCGATSVALHLAGSLDKRTCYLDATPDHGAALRLGLDIPVGPGPLDEDLDPVPVCGGFGYAPAMGAALPEVVARLRARFDSIVIDLPAHRLGELAEATTSAVLVMAPAVPSARRAAAILERHDGMSWAVVTNRLGPGGELRASELASIVGRRVGLQLPCSPGLRDAEDDGRLLTSMWSPWRRSIGKLAQAVF